MVKKDPKTEKSYHVGLVLRKNGHLEVYSDFLLVYEYMDDKLQCVDIATSFNSFYFKLVDSDKVTSESKIAELPYEYRMVHHFWRNRISFETSKIKNENTW